MSGSPYNPQARGRESANGKQTMAASALPGTRHPDGSGDGHGRPPAVGAEPTDEQLLADYRHGDKASFSRLVNRYQRELFHFLVRFLGNRA